MTKGAILQSNYIPWKGYFDIIRSVDLFIFHDDLQYTKGDWRNRNKIKTPNGTKWLTIPCGTNENRLICEVELKDSSWQKKHWQLIVQNYCKAPNFKLYKSFFEEIFLNNKWNNLSVLNQTIIKKISIELLNTKTSFADSREYKLKKRKSERVVELCKKAGISHYLTGPSAKNYLMEENLQQAEIKLEWMKYPDYPQYNQLYPPFEHYVSIIDLLFNEGPNATKYMKTFKLENMI